MVYKDRWDWKMERMKKKITLGDIAEHIKCSITLLSKYENNERNMRLDKVDDYKCYIMNTDDIK